MENKNICYKVFQKEDDKLYPLIVKEYFEHYPTDKIITRPDGYGPFGCFDSFESIVDFFYPNLTGKTIDNYLFVVHKVKIKPSKSKRFWLNKDDIPELHHVIFEVTNKRLYLEEKGFLNKGVIYANEFEILEDVTESFKEYVKYQIDYNDIPLIKPLDGSLDEFNGEVMETDYKDFVWKKESIEPDGFISLLKTLYKKLVSFLT